MLAFIWKNSGFVLLFSLPAKVEITSRRWGRQAINVLNSSILSYTYLSWDIYVHTKQTTERLLRLADGKSVFKSQEPFVLETVKSRGVFCSLLKFFILFRRVHSQIRCFVFSTEQTDIYAVYYYLQFFTSE